MPKSAFAELCEQRSVEPEEWRRNLRTPLISRKCLLDMTDEELEDHYTQVEERAENTQEDRALLMLEGALDGRLERQARKVFAQSCNDKGNIEAEQVPEMLESLRYELSNIEVHFLLRKFGCTEDFEMIPEALLTQKQWLWLVGECEMMKQSYKYINQEAFEICYETMVQNLKMQKESEQAREDWPRLFSGGPDWFTDGASTRPWVLQPELEKELIEQMAEEEYGKTKRPHT